MNEVNHGEQQMVFVLWNTSQNKKNLACMCMIQNGKDNRKIDRKNEK